MTPHILMSEVGGRLFLLLSFLLIYMHHKEVHDVGCSSLFPVSLVESNVSIVFDELAVSKRSPQGCRDSCVILHVIVAKDFLHMLGGLLAVIEGHV